jgi:1,4-dihydroxy-6-naphthoate synthase
VAPTPAPANVGEALRGKRIAVPGKLTTAYLVLQLMQPEFEAVFVAFDRIVDAVRDGSVDAGLIIHESQLTYAREGLHLWADTGEWWHSETGLPLPLGGNAIRRDLGDTLIRKVSHDLRASIVYGLQHRDAALDHAMHYARGLDRAEADEFVGMYVNDYTVDYGDDGRQGVRTLLDRAAEAGLIPGPVPVDFVAD